MKNKNLIQSFKNAFNGLWITYKKEKKMIKIENKKAIVGRKLFSEEGYFIEEFECPQCKTKLIVIKGKWSFPVFSF
jgi:hypothetical protein